MKAYWVSLYTEILDQDKLKKYGENAIPVIKKFGGTPVVRGGKLKYYSGDKILRTVIGNFQIMIRRYLVMTQKII